MQTTKSKIAVFIFVSILTSFFALTGSAFDQCEAAYVPLQTALNAMNSDAQVNVTTVTVSLDLWDDPNYYYEFTPTCGTPTEALILYPGANLDARAYAVQAHAIAASGFLVAIVPMTDYFAFNGIDRADAIISNHPEIEKWSIGGHSLGGVAACYYVTGGYTYTNKINGVVLWASYPDSTQPLTSIPVKVISIYGTSDGLVLYSEDIGPSKANLPANTDFVAIQGANHSQFGWYATSATDYGFVQPKPAPGDNPATITRQQQNDFTVQYTISLMLSLTSQDPINLPQTGQTTCWDSSGTVIPCTGTGQDGDIQAGVAWPNPRFVDNSDGTVTDKVTGLMWTKNANLPAGRIYWQDALNYIANMNSANGGSGTYGYTDWRLPNFVEMESLENEQADYLDTWLIGQGFTNVQRNAYWSSTTYVDDTTRAWVLLVQDQNIAASAKTGNTRYVWPVRSGQCGASGGSKICLHKTGQTISYAAGDDGALQKGVGWPSARFTDNGSGAVTDNLTGLMWTKNANLPNGTITWQQALDYVKTLNIGGYTDWRLPNRKEIRSLFDYSQVNPALSPGYPFTDIKLTSAADFYWTSTSKAHVPASVWKVCMYDGTNGDGYKNLGYYFWPVRGDSQATVITLASFNAAPKSHKVLLVWTTESEIDNAGFNIYRSETENGEYSKINHSTIPAQGSSTKGSSYEFVDDNVQNRKTYYYKLEDIDLNGTSTMHGPKSATPRLIYGIGK